MSQNRPDMAKCLQATRWISESQETDLPLWQRLTLRMHLQICTDCRNFQKNSEALRRIMQHYAEHGESEGLDMLMGNMPDEEDAPGSAGGDTPPD